MYEKDFILDENVDFEIDKKKFTYKPVSAGDELKWVGEYLEVIEGKAVQNFEKKTICKLRNLIQVPYDKETINKIIHINKDWTELNNEEKFNVLSRLSPSMFDKIITAINKIDQSDDLEQKKN